MRQPVHVLAVYPVTQTSRDTESYIENAIGAAAESRNDEMVLRAHHAQCSRPAGPAPAAHRCAIGWTTAGDADHARIDPLRSDGAKLEAALRRADVAVERRDYEGVTHEFFGCAAVITRRAKRSPGRASACRKRSPAS
ncbi:MAG: hypothetical protein WDO12_02545 [Pseudomonadota bacterium]